METFPRIDQTKDARRKRWPEVKEGVNGTVGLLVTITGGKTRDGDGTVVSLGVWTQWRLAAALAGVAAVGGGP